MSEKQVREIKRNLCINCCVRYTNEYGDYYGAAHIEKADANEIYISY